MPLSEKLYEQLTSCIQTIPGAKQMTFPKTGTDHVVHVTVGSFIFGFIDDLYVQFIPNDY